MKKTIYFIRHAETEFNRMKIVQGSGVDSDLNEKGKAQGKSFYDNYKEVGFDLILTSNLKRTHQTVQHFIDENIPWEKYAELNEMSWGVHEGKKAAPWMEANYQAMVGAWNSGDYTARVPEGESAEELGVRINQFMQMLKGREEKNILVCTHGRTMCAITCYLESRPLMDMHMFKNHNTALTKAVYDGEQFIVEFKGDTSHLQR